MKSHLLTCCLLLWGISLTAKAYQNPVFGTWNPPASLLPFWTGIDPKWWSEPGRKDLVEYCEHYAKTHKPQLLLDDIIEDQKLNPEVTRTFVYSWVVTSWSDPMVMKKLKRLYRDGTQKEKSIAADFIAEIESDESQH